MKIDSINSTPTVQVLKNKKAAQEDTPIETEAPEGTENTESEENAKGVITLLQAGHFKGVADVRLRINFYEELQALEAQNLKEAASGSFDEFNQSVQGQIDALNESGLLNEDQTAALDAFLENVQNAQNEFMEGQNSTVKSLLETLQNDFDSLLALLDPSTPEHQQEPEVYGEDAVSREEILQTPAAESPAETAPGEELIAEETTPQPTEPEPVLEEPAEEPDPLLGLVQSFQESIQGLIDSLQSDLTDTSVIPDISEPSGNGKAYAKFMAIYENMLISPTNAEPDEQLDVQEPSVPNEGETSSETNEQ